jgi:hypothetical protein
LSFFAVVFWTVIIGPVGALLAVPLTLLARALILGGDDDAVWLRWVSGDRGAIPSSLEIARESPHASDRRPARRIPWNRLGIGRRPS